MSHPKHHGHGQQPRKKGSNGPLVGLVVAAVALTALFWLGAVNTKPTNTNSIPVIKEDSEQKNHFFKVAAWCDHMPIWNESPRRRHVMVEASKDTEIQSVEVKHNGKLLEASVRLGSHVDTDTSKMHIYGAFSEGMHGSDLEIVITYMVMGVKYQTIMHCTIEVTN
jgi:hypothetical protein